jgi:hypothetical protein
VDDNILPWSLYSTLLLYDFSIKGVHLPRQLQRITYENIGEEKKKGRHHASILNKEGGGQGWPRLLHMDNHRVKKTHGIGRGVGVGVQECVGWNSLTLRIPTDYHWRPKRFQKVEAF